MKKKKPVTHVALILDRSGSMSSIRNEAVGAFNDQLRVTKEAEEDGQKNFVTLVTFATLVDKPHYFDVPAGQVPDLTDDKYKPSGGTALFDALGSTMEKLEKLSDSSDENTSFLVVVVTDGYENSSRNFKREDIANKIGELKKTKRWTFVYLCANQDPTEIQKNLNIDAGNTRSFIATSEGTRQATSMHSDSLTNYFVSRSLGATSSSNFYNESDNSGAVITDGSSLTSGPTPDSPSKDAKKV